MVWGAFNRNGTGPTYRINGIMDRNIYVNEICEGVLLPYSEEYLPLNWIFQQDNDPKHTSSLAKDWFKRNEVNLLKWPAQSPDLNPIENLWRDLEKEVRKLKPINLRELEQAVMQGWHNIPVERCRQLVDSMPRRCAAVIRNKGYPTKY